MRLVDDRAFPLAPAAGALCSPVALSKFDGADPPAEAWPSGPEPLALAVTEAAAGRCAATGPSPPGPQAGRPVGKGCCSCDAARAKRRCPARPPVGNHAAESLAAQPSGPAGEPSAAAGARPRGPLADSSASALPPAAGPLAGTLPVPAAAALAGASSATGAPGELGASEPASLAPLPRAARDSAGRAGLPPAASPLAEAERPRRASSWRSCPRDGRAGSEADSSESDSVAARIVGDGAPPRWLNRSADALGAVAWPPPHTPSSCAVAPSDDAVPASSRLADGPTLDDSAHDSASGTPMLSCERWWPDAEDTGAGAAPRAAPLAFPSVTEHAAAVAAAAERGSDDGADAARAPPACPPEEDSP